MNGTPSIFEHYAVLENPPGVVPPTKTSLPVSLVLLARGPWAFRSAILAEAAGWGFSETLLVETGSPGREVVGLSRDHPWVRILVPHQPWNPGQRINAAALEVRNAHFVVLWDDQRPNDFHQWMRVLAKSVAASVVLIAPERRDRDGRELPSVAVPALERDRLKILTLGTDQEVVDTLFPVDFCGLYDRQRFLHTGGFDVTLQNSFWQVLDWGLRSRLWGERLCVERSLKADYLSDHPLDDQTPDRSYPRFFLRNLAVRHGADHGYLPWTRLWTHLRLSGLSLSASLRAFLRDREWVRKHRYRFQTDARVLTELWGRQ